MKTKLYYIILTSIFIALLISCDPKAFEYSHIINYKIVNNTNKTYICQITQSVADKYGKVSEYGETLDYMVYGYDSINICFRKTAMIKYYENKNFYFNDAEICLYNLSDTSIFNFWHTVGYAGINNEYIIYDTNYSIPNPPESWHFLAFLLEITPEMLSLFEKDYSMLEKFPEYYGN